MHITVQDTVLPVLVHIVYYLEGIPGFQQTSYSVCMMGLTMKSLIIRNTQTNGQRE